ncbi:hypothetical protein NHF46_04030 [Arthrobacter alpinus]|nr:hypothetical protein [Arthrobacter alpinus]
MIVGELFTALVKPFRDAVFAAGIDKIRSLSVKVLIACSLISLTAALVGYFLMEWGVTFFFGEAFSPAIPAAKILLVGGAIKGISYVVNGILVVQGRALARIYATYTGVIVLIVVAITLSDHGATGAAISFATAYGTMLLMDWSRCAILSFQHRPTTSMPQIWWKINLGDSMQTRIYVKHGICFDCSQF